jgi:hypothetical protein
MVEQYYSARTYEEKREHLESLKKYNREEEALKAQIKKLEFTNKVLDYVSIGVCVGLIVGLVALILYTEGDKERRRKKMLEESKVESKQYREELNELRAEFKEGLKAYEASLDMKTR